MELITVGDCVVLERAPFDHPDTVADISVDLTVLDGTVAYDRRTD